MSRIRNVLENHPFFVLIGVFISGFVISTSIWSFFKPYLITEKVQEQKIEINQLKGELSKAQQVHENSDSPKPKKFLEDVELPLKIGVIGPITGEMKDIGLSHLVGVKSGVLHYYHEFCVVDDVTPLQEVDFKIYDTGVLYGELPDNDRFIKMFKTAQEECDVLFGPVMSESVKRMIINSNIEIKKPIVLTLAATPLIRSHKDYGKIIFQLSNNIQSYADQFIRYFADFHETKPKRIACIFRNDEYGKSSNYALGKAAAEQDISQYSSLTFDPYRPTEDIFSTLNIEELELKNSSDEVVFIAAFGVNLETIVKGIQDSFPNTSIATLTSVNPDQVKDGLFNECFLIYSFIPKLVSLETLSFYRYCRTAQLQLNDDLAPNYIPNSWTFPGTAEAEAHDASVWFVNQLAHKFKCEAETPRKLYSTSFVLENSDNLSNNGSLYIFKVVDGLMSPVQL